MSQVTENSVQLPVAFLLRYEGQIFFHAAANHTVKMTM